MKKFLILAAACLTLASSYSQTPKKTTPVKPVTKKTVGTANTAILIGSNVRPLRFGAIKSIQLPVMRRNSGFVQNLRTARPVSGGASGTTISKTKIPPREDRLGEGSEIDAKGQYCTFATVSEANGDFTKIVLGNQNDKIYPGAIYSSASVIDGAYNAPSLQLKPYDITTNLFSSSTAGTSSYVRVQPSLGDVYNGISQLMSRSSGVRNASSVAVEVEDIYSSEQLGFFLQADYQGYGVDLNAEFDYNKRTKRHLLFAKLTQVYFSVSLNRPRGDSLVSNPLSSIPSDLLYVNKVNYGRIGIIRIESDSSQESVEAALNFAYEGSGQEVGLQARLRYEKVLANCNIKGFFFGGDATNVIEINSATDLRQFNEYVRNGLRLDPTVAPVPISYEMKFLKDNGTAWVNSTTSYPERNCVPAKDLEITFNGISIEDIHGGDCSYAWGSIDLEVWELNRDGIKTKRVPAVESGALVRGTGIRMWDYPNSTQPQRNMINYASIRAGQNVDMNQTDGKKWRFRIDPARVAANEVMIIVTCDINTNHKDNDIASLGFHGMRRRETRSYRLSDVLVTNPRDLQDPAKAKYGSMKPGPFTSYSGSDRVHQFRAHFTVMPKN